MDPNGEEVNLVLFYLPRNLFMLRSLMWFCIYCEKRIDVILQTRKSKTALVKIQVKYSIQFTHDR